MRACIALDGDAGVGPYSSLAPTDHNSISLQNLSRLGSAIKRLACQQHKPVSPGGDAMVP
jgi:hypothetical protein